MPKETKTAPDAAGLSVDLLRVARALEADAHYLRARLFRAAALGVAARASRSDLRLGAGLEEAAEAAVTGLEAQGAQPTLVAALHEALIGISKGTPPLPGEIVISVCARCGDVSLGDNVMAPCGGCGSGPLAARPVFTAPYYTPAPLDQVLAGLEMTPRLVGQMCEGVRDERAQTGAWPVMDILDHLVGAQRLIWRRAQRMLDENEPDLGGGVPPPRASDESSDPLTVAGLITTFADERSQLLGRARYLAPQEWDRGGTAPSWGRTTVRQRLTYMVRHEHDHLGDLVESLSEARAT